MRDVRVELYEWLLSERSGSRDCLNLLERHLTYLATAGMPGAVTEFGGDTAAWMRAVLDASGDPEREIRVYDTDAGDLLAAHDTWNLRRPTVHAAGDLPDRIVFAYLNEKNAGGLTQLLPRLAAGAAVVLDGYTEPGDGSVTGCGLRFGVYRHRIRPDLPAARRAPDQLSILDTP